MYPFALQYTVLRDAAAVHCQLYMTPQFSLGTQTGRRPVYNDRPQWDIPFKITYAGSQDERRASYISPIPTTKHATVASLQHGPLAIVLYEVDMKGSNLNRGMMRLDIEPADGGMCDEFRVAGKDYDRRQVRLASGEAFGWRVADTCVAIRLLQSRHAVAGPQDARDDIAYRLGPVPDGGLCLDCPLSPTAGQHASNNLSAGFVVACATRNEYNSLASFLETFIAWDVAESRETNCRTVCWQAGETQLRLAWNEASNRVISKSVNGQPVTATLRYDSPLIRLRDGDPLSVIPRS
jgi:hypothetical protein